MPQEAPDLGDREGNGQPRAKKSPGKCVTVDNTGHNERPSRLILESMTTPRAATRRYLPGSPFNNRPPAPPIEQYEVHDQVTHDRFGLGRVIGVEGDVAVLVDFGAQQARITSPFAKLTKL